VREKRGHVLFITKNPFVKPFFRAFFPGLNETIPCEKERFLSIRDLEMVPLTALIFKDILVGKGRNSPLIPSVAKNNSEEPGRVA